MKEMLDFTDDKWKEIILGIGGSIIQMGGLRTSPNMVARYLV